MKALLICPCYQTLSECWSCFVRWFCEGQSSVGTPATQSRLSAQCTRGWSTCIQVERRHARTEESNCLLNCLNSKVADFRFPCTMVVPFVSLKQHVGVWLQIRRARIRETCIKQRHICSWHKPYYWRNGNVRGSRAVRQPYSVHGVWRYVTVQGNESDEVSSLLPTLGLAPSVKNSE